MLEVKVGERRRTKWKKRVIVAEEHLCSGGPRGGQVRFYFEDEGPKPYQQRMSYHHWIRYEHA